MFNNIGAKIKGLAKVLTWLGIIVSVIAGFTVIFSGNLLSGVLGSLNSYGGYNSYGYNAPRGVSGGMVAAGIAVMVFGSLFAWIGSFLLYGFGHLIENSDKIASRS